MKSLSGNGSMHLLVLNAGSSSLKYELFAAEPGVEMTSLTDGLVERIGEPGSDSSDHATALSLVLSKVEQFRHDAAQPLLGIGHRVVHGGETFDRPVLINDDVLSAIERASILAPLHNPPALAGIRAAQKLLPDVAHVAVFDTAFHQTMPPHVYRYALPAWCYEKFGLRRYGMHGTSHAYVSRKAAQLLGRNPATVNVITLHLGNGASAAAVAGGKCVETSMGFTPLEGLVMGTRSGDLDPSIPAYLAAHAQLDLSQTTEVLNRQSGLKGLCGDSDMRTVLRRAHEGDASADLAVQIYCHRIRKYIGAYAAVLGKLDSIAFTGGVGENASAIRSRTCQGLEILGLRLDHAKNQACQRGLEQDIAEDESPVRILVIPTDEEREIAIQMLALLEAEH